MLAIQSLMDECGVRLGPGGDNNGIIQSWHLGDDTRKLIRALIEVGESRRPYGKPPTDIYDAFEGDFLDTIGQQVSYLTAAIDRLKS